MVFEIDSILLKNLIYISYETLNMLKGRKILDGVFSEVITKKHASFEEIKGNPSTGCTHSSS